MTRGVIGRNWRTAPRRSPPRCLRRRARLGVLPARGLLPIVPAVAFLLLFFVVPLAENGAHRVWLPSPGGGRLSAEYYVKLFSDSYYLTVIGQTILLSFIVTAICA